MSRDRVVDVDNKVVIENKEVISDSQSLSTPKAEEAKRNATKLPELTVEQKLEKETEVLAQLKLERGFYLTPSQKGDKGSAVKIFICEEKIKQSEEKLQSLIGQKTTSGIEITKEHLDKIFDDLAKIELKGLSKYRDAKTDQEKQLLEKELISKKEAGAFGRLKEIGSNALTSLQQVVPTTKESLNLVLGGNFVQGRAAIEAGLSGKDVLGSAVDTGQKFIESNREYYNTHAPKGSVLGSDKEFVNLSLPKAGFNIAINPLATLGEATVKPILEVADVGRVEAQRGVYNVTGGTNVTHHEYLEMENTEGLLKLAKLSFKTGEASLALAAMGPARIGDILRPLTVSGGMGAGTSLSQELLSDEGFVIDRFLENTVAGTADSLVFMGGLGAVSKGYVRTRIGNEISTKIKQGEALTQKELSIINSAVKEAQKITSTVDFIDSQGDLQQSIANFDNVDSARKLIGALLGTAISVEDGFDVSQGLKGFNSRVNSSPSSVIPAPSNVIPAKVAGPVTPAKAVAGIQSDIENTVNANINTTEISTPDANPANSKQSLPSQSLEAIDLVSLNSLSLPKISNQNSNNLSSMIQAEKELEQILGLNEELDYTDIEKEISTIQNPITSRLLSEGIETISTINDFGELEIEILPVRNGKELNEYAYRLNKSKGVKLIYNHDMIETESADGLYSPNDKIIYLPKDSIENLTVTKTLRHEKIHALLDRILDEGGDSFAFGRFSHNGRETTLEELITYTEDLNLLSKELINTNHDANIIASVIQNKATILDSYNQSLLNLLDIIKKETPSIEIKKRIDKDGNTVFVKLGIINVKDQKIILDLSIASNKADLISDDEAKATFISKIAQLSKITKMIDINLDSLSLANNIQDVIHIITNLRSNLFPEYITPGSGIQAANKVSTNIASSINNEALIEVDYDYALSASKNDNPNVNKKHNRRHFLGFLGATAAAGMIVSRSTKDISLDMSDKIESIDPQNKLHEEFGTIGANSLNNPIHLAEKSAITGILLALGKICTTQLLKELNIDADAFMKHNSQIELKKQLTKKPLDTVFHAIIAAPIIEEYLFRLMPSQMATKQGDRGLAWKTGIPTSILFSLLHNIKKDDNKKGFEKYSFDTEHFSIPTFLSGLTFWYIQRQYGVDNAIISHMTNNITHMAFNIYELLNESLFLPDNRSISDSDDTKLDIRQNSRSQNLDSNNVNINDKSKSIALIKNYSSIEKESGIKSLNWYVIEPKIVEGLGLVAEHRFNIDDSSHNGVISTGLCGPCLGLIFVPENSMDDGIWLGHWSNSNLIHNFIETIPKELRQNGRFYLHGLNDGDVELGEEENSELRESRTSVVNKMIEQGIKPTQIETIWVDKESYGTEMVWDWVNEKISLVASANKNKIIRNQHLSSFENNINPKDNIAPTFETKNSSTLEEQKNKALNKVILEMYKQLSEGTLTIENIPKAYLEEEKMIDPASKEGNEFQEMMMKILFTLVPDPEFSELLKKHPITFLMSDKKEANGYIIPTKNQTIICFDKELFLKCENLNQFAYIFLHELTHLKIYDIFGEGANSQTEEGACDIRPLRKMADIKLNMNEAKSIMSKLNEQPVPPWMSIVDVHALPYYRLELISNGIGIVQGMLGTAGNADLMKIIKMPKELLDLANKSTHKSYIKTTLNDTNFDNLDLKSQANILKDLFQDIKSPYYSRAIELKELFKLLKIQDQSSEQTEILRDLIDEITNHPLAFNLNFLSLTACIPKQVLQQVLPYTKVGMLKNEFSKFISSNIASDIKAHAKNIMQIYEQLKHNELNLGLLGIEGFSLLDKKAYKQMKKEDGSAYLPWHQHIDSKSLKQNPDDNVIKTLWLLGVWDQRLISRASTQSLKDLSDGKYQNISVVNSSDDLDFYMIETDSFGDIIKLNSKKFLINGQITQQMLDDYVQRVDTELINRNIDKSVKQLPSESTDFTINDFLEYPDQFFELWYNEIGSAKLTTLQKSNYLAEMHHCYSLVSYFSRAMNSADNLIKEKAISIIEKFFKDALEAKDKKSKLESLSHINHEGQAKKLNAESSAGPLIRYIINNPHSILTKEQQLSLLSNFLHAGEILLDIRNIIGYDTPKNSDDLYKVIELYESVGIYFRHSANLHNASSTNQNPIGRALITDVALFIRNQDKSAINKLLLEKPHIISKVCGVSKYEYFEPESKAKPTINELIRQYLMSNIDIGNDITQHAKTFFTLDNINYFQTHQDKILLFNKMYENIYQCKDINLKINAIESFLLSNNDIYELEIRNKLIELWLDSIVSIHGTEIDNLINNSDYIKKIKEIIDRVDNGAVSQTKFAMLNRLCTRIISQRELSHYAEKALYSSLDRNGMIKIGEMLGVSQTAFTIFTDKRKNKSNLLDFLINPLEKKGTELFIDSLLNNKNIDTDSSEFKNINIRSFLTKEAQNFHDNFWSMPLIGRTLFISDLLFNKDSKVKNADEKEVIFISAAEKCIEKLIPLEDKNKKKIPFAKESRELLSAFLAKGVLNDNQRPLFLSSLMAAMQMSNSSEEVRVGQRLATLLEMMGPAWKKLGQAISSHPDTPIEIARDMEPLKGKPDMPRWEMWGLYENVVPKEIRDNTPYLGPVISTASFFTTVDAGDTVFSLLSPYAREKADDGFSTMEKLVNELSSGKYEIGSKVNSVLVDMIRSSKISAALEANSRVGAELAKEFERRYTDTIVIIDGEEILFETAAWLNYGTEFKQMKKKTGMPLNDLVKLSKTDSKKLKQVQLLSIGIIALELKHNSDGGAKCDDRHGRNIIVEDNKVKMIDVGGMHAILIDNQGNVIDPTDFDLVDKILDNGGKVIPYEPGNANNEDMRLFAETLVEILIGLKDKIDPTSIIHEKISKTKLENKDPEHLIRTERNLLALQDAFQQIEDRENILLRIFAGQYQDGGKKCLLHPTVKEYLEKAVSEGKLGEANGVANMALKALNLLGGNKGQAMLNAYFKANVKTPIIVKQGDRTKITQARYWNTPRNRKEFSTLVKEADFQK